MDNTAKEAVSGNRFICLVEVDEILRRVGEPGTMEAQCRMAEAVKAHLPPDIRWSVTIVPEHQAANVLGVAAHVLYEDALVLHAAQKFAEADKWWQMEGRQRLIEMLDDHTVYDHSQFQLENLLRVLRGLLEKANREFQKKEGEWGSAESVRYRICDLLERIERKLLRFNRNVVVDHDMRSLFFRKGDELAEY